MDELLEKTLPEEEQETPESTEKEAFQSSNHFVTRIIALVLAILMAAELALTSAARVDFDSDQFEGSAKFSAADYLASMDTYLSASELQRMRTVVSLIGGNPKNYEEYSMCASIAIADEDYEKAAEYMEVCVEQYEGDDEGLANLLIKLGCIYSLLSWWGKATRTFNRALEINEDNPSTLLLVAESYLQTGKYSLALDCMEEYGKLQALTADQYSVVAAMQSEIGKYDEAIETCTKAMDMEDSDRLELLTIRAQAYLLKGDTANAQKDAAEITKLSGDSGTQDTVKALCQEADGDYAGALETYRKLIAAGSATADLYEEAVQCAYLADDYESMVALSEEVLAMETEGDEVYAVFYKWLGLGQLVLGNYGAAEENINTYLQYDEQFYELYYFRGLARMGNGSYNGAISDFTVCVNDEIMVDECLYNRGLCYAQVGNEDAAMADFNLILKRNATPDVVAEVRALMSEVATAAT